MKIDPENYGITSSRCWDCHRATGGCSWSDSLIPVEGWTAEDTKRIRGDKTVEHVMVIKCPLFVRDAYRGGLYRYKENEQ